jgi:hypothetical protein
MSNIVTLYNTKEVNPNGNKVMRGVEVSGWYPVDIEYSWNYDAGLECLVWKISGTEHTFSIQADIIDKIHGDNIKEHFIQTLERFLEHYNKWQEFGYSEDWKAKYKKEFGERIKS